MLGNPSVAVLLATYNGATYLPELLDSLCQQTGVELVLFVRDDGSTDDTIETIASFQDRLRIRWVRRERRLGPAKSFMTLLSEAESGFEYFAFCDQDDYWLPEKLEEAVYRLQKMGVGPAMYCSALEYVDYKLQHLGFSPPVRKISLENALVENIATGCTIVINRASRDLLLSGDPTSIFVMHDWWIYLVMAALGGVHHDPRPMIKYRQHSRNAIGAETAFFRRYRRKLKRFIFQKKSEYVGAKAAEELKTRYLRALSNRDLDLIDSLLAAKASTRKRWQICLASPYQRQSWLDTLVLRLMFLLNRF